MNTVPPVIKGTKAEFTVTALDSSLVDVAFSNSDTITAKVLPGGRRAAAMTPTCAWTDAANGVITVTMSASQTASMSAGIYRLDVRVARSTDASNPLAIVTAFVEFLDAEGAVAEATAWATLADMQAYYPGIEKHQTPKDQAGYGYQLIEATNRIRWRIYERYDPQPGFQRRRVENAFDDVYGFDKIDSDTIPPGKETVLAALDADSIELDATLVRIVAMDAVGQVLKRQINPLLTGTTTAPKASDNPYNAKYEQVMSEIDAAFATWRARLKIGSASVNVLIDRDCVFLSGYTG